MSPAFSASSPACLYTPPNGAAISPPLPTCPLSASKLSSDGMASGRHSCGSGSHSPPATMSSEYLEVNKLLHWSYIWSSYKQWITPDSKRRGITEREQKWWQVSRKSTPEWRGRQALTLQSSGNGEGLKMCIYIEGMGTSNNVSMQLLKSNRSRIPWWEVEDCVRGCMHPLAQISGIHKRESASDYASLNFCLRRDIMHAGNDNLVGGSYFIAVVVMWCRHSTHSTHKSTPQAVAQGARCGWCAVCIVVDSYCPSTHKQMLAAVVGMIVVVIIVLLSVVYQHCVCCVVRHW